MKIFITGGSGFIGTNFIINALNKNHIIYNIDNLSLFSRDKNFNHKNYTFSQVDINDQDSVLEILNKFEPDKIINMAAESHVDKSIIFPEIFLKTNIMGTYHLLEASLKFWKTKKKKLILLSSCFYR